MRLIKLWEADLEKAYELQISFEQNENGFENAAYGFALEQYKEYIEKRKNYSAGIGLPEGYVPDTVYILADEEKYVGIFNLRHCLNESLENGAGHIGYGIVKEYRGRGYGTAGLKMMIEEAKATIPEDEIYMSANKDNLASVRVQQKNGAYIHHEDEKKYYSRIRIK